VFVFNLIEAIWFEQDRVPNVTLLIELFELICRFARVPRNIHVGIFVATQALWLLLEKVLV